MEAIGEWGVRVTPLELLRAYQNLALLAAKHDAKLAPLFSGLEGSVSYGMGHLVRPNATMQVAGKTGTSLVEEGTWRHGWFAGYAPADKPEMALVVFPEKGNGPDAAGVAREIFGAHAADRGQGVAHNDEQRAPYLKQHSDAYCVRNGMGQWRSVINILVAQIVCSMEYAWLSCNHGVRQRD